jgi:TPR repeat protein
MNRVMNILLLVVFLMMFSIANVSGCESFSECKTLATQGDAGAQYSLGFMYTTGNGAPQDYKEAAKWYGKAAEQGNVWAQYSVGVIFAKGEGVPQDYKEAVRWYRKAAEQGDAGAQYSLGYMYAKGEGVPQDYIKAHMFWTLASAGGNADAKNNRDMVAKKMTPEQIATAQQMTKEWVEAH